MALGDDEPMQNDPASKPRRRFAPQLVEETTRKLSAPGSSSYRRGTDEGTGSMSDHSPVHNRRPANDDDDEGFDEEFDEDMPDAPEPQAEPEPEPAPKPRRRFAPQLVEETVKKSSEKPSAPEAADRSTARNTRDASVQVDDVDMPDAPPVQPKPQRRFVPVPIETTFDSYRVNRNNQGQQPGQSQSQNQNPHGPTAELTPDPSPTTPQPLPPPIMKSPGLATGPVSDASPRHVKIAAEPKEKKPKRKFAPQLIETSRRTRKDGQDGPATKPTDKTDITPGTNHIYARKPKRTTPAQHRPSQSGAVVIPYTEGDSAPQSPSGLGRRRQPSMKPHLNTRNPSKANSYHPDLDTIVSSESGESSEEEEDPEKKAAGSPGGSWKTRSHEAAHRRESCDEDFAGYLLAVAAREAYRQREWEQVMSAFPNGLPAAAVEHFFARDNSEDDHAEMPESPLRHGPSQMPNRRKSTDPGWAVKEMRAHAEKLAQERDGDMSVDQEPKQSETTTAPPAEPPLWSTGSPMLRPLSRNNNNHVTEAQNSHLITSSPSLRPRASPALDRTPFSLPPNSQAEKSGAHQPASAFRLPNAFRAGAEKDDSELRKVRQAASPPMLGNDLTFRRCPSPVLTRMEPNQPYNDKQPVQEKQHDTSEASGLWRGYCSNKPSEKTPKGLWAPSLLATPGEPASPPDAAEDPDPSKSRNQPKGLQLLPGLDERLRKEMERKEFEEMIEHEFNDAFVTQVYNYISLGYPAAARPYDDELSKISGISIWQLRKDDHEQINKGFMLDMEISLKATRGSRSSSDSSGDEVTWRSPEEDERRSRIKPPRWRALKLYVREWARQHPHLNHHDGPSAWGVRARRGSWAI